TRESLRPVPMKGRRRLLLLDPRMTTLWATQVQLPLLRVCHSAGVFQTREWSRLFLMVTKEGH
ncbi:unnamed protein product, partial [Tetraodon nigroviridis]